MDFVKHKKSFKPFLLSKILMAVGLFTAMSSLPVWANASTAPGQPAWCDNLRLNSSIEIAIETVMNAIENRAQRHSINLETTSNTIIRNYRRVQNVLEQMLISSVPLRVNQRMFEAPAGLYAVCINNPNPNDLAETYAGHGGPIGFKTHFFNLPLMQRVNVVLHEAVHVIDQRNLNGSPSSGRDDSEWFYECFATQYQFSIMNDAGRPAWIQQRYLDNCRLTTDFRWPHYN